MRPIRAVSPAAACSPALSLFYHHHYHDHRHQHHIVLSYRRRHCYRHHHPSIPAYFVLLSLASLNLSFPTYLASCSFVSLIIGNHYLAVSPKASIFPDQRSHCPLPSFILPHLRSLSHSHPRSQFKRNSHAFFSCSHSFALSFSLSPSFSISPNFPQHSSSYVFYSHPRFLSLARVHPFVPTKKTVNL